MSGSVRHLVVVKKVLQLQMLLALIVALCTYLVHRNIHDVYSSIIGAIIAIVPTLVYIRIAFKNGLVTSPVRALSKHQKAFFVRFALNLILFSIVFLFCRNCNFLILFISYGVVLSAYWLSLVKTGT